MFQGHRRSAIAGLFYCVSSVLANNNPPSPFIFYNDSARVGDSAYVRWDVNSFPAGINLWVQENYPNSSHPEISISYDNTKGEMLWELGAQSPWGDLPGRYYYELQDVSGNGIIYKSAIFTVVCAACDLPPPSTATAPDPTDASSSPASSISPTPTASQSSPASPASQGISVGAAAGIGVGSAAVVAIIALLIWFFRHKAHQKKKQRLRDDQQQKQYQNPHMGEVHDSLPPHHAGDHFPEMAANYYSTSSQPSSPIKYNMNQGFHKHTREWSRASELNGTTVGGPTNPNTPYALNFHENVRDSAASAQEMPNSPATLKPNRQSDFGGEDMQISPQAKPPPSPRSPKSPQPSSPRSLSRKPVQGGDKGLNLSHQALSGGDDDAYQQYEWYGRYNENDGRN